MDGDQIFFWQNSASINFLAGWVSFSWPLQINQKKQPGINQPNNHPPTPDLDRGETQVTLHLWICSKFQQSYLTERGSSCQASRFPVLLAVAPLGGDSMEGLALLRQLRALLFYKWNSSCRNKRAESQFTKWGHLRFHLQSVIYPNQSFLSSTAADFSVSCLWGSKMISSFLSQVCKAQKSPANVCMISPLHSLKRTAKAAPRPQKETIVFQRNPFSGPMLVSGRVALVNLFFQ